MFAFSCGDMKHTFDFLVSLTCIILLIVPMILIAILIAIVMGFPVLFTQTRSGKHGKPFIFYKFRTMTQKTDLKGILLPDKYRLTRTGEFLRNTSLDELPSLWNVLRGDMSLVGPRPLLIEYLDYYTDKQYRRHEVKPGITGWAQINGRNTISWEEKFNLDVWYVDNQSMWLDIKIIFKTIIVVLIMIGINQDRHITMRKFNDTETNHCSK